MRAFKTPALFLLCVCLCATWAQTTPAETARQEGMRNGYSDAHAEQGKEVWFLAGCFTGPIGLLILYSTDFTPPPQRLLGKSSDYTFAYSSAYQFEARKERAMPTWIGCVCGGVVGVILGFAVFIDVLVHAGDGG